MDAATQSSTFRVERMTRTDFSEILRPYNRRGGDLTVPHIPLCWPVPEGDPRDDDEALLWLEYSTRLQAKLFDTDPTSHFVKAVTRDGEITRIARWNFFPHGYDFERDELFDVGEFVPEGALEHYKIDLWQDMRTAVVMTRRDWIRKGPAWSVFEPVSETIVC